jgi:hypothetical protein
VLTHDLLRFHQNAASSAHSAPEKTLSPRRPSTKVRINAVDATGQIRSASPAFIVHGMTTSAARDFHHARQVSKPLTPAELVEKPDP